MYIFSYILYHLQKLDLCLCISIICMMAFSEYVNSYMASLEASSDFSDRIAFLTLGVNLPS